MPSQLHTTYPHECLQCAQKFHSVFNMLSDGELAKLSQYKTCSFYKKGQYIFTENSNPHYLFCIHSGKIKLSNTGYDGKEQILRLVKSGDILGYRALMTNERYHCSAVALEDCSICSIDKQYFLDLVKRDNKLLFEVVRRISNDLKTAEEHIVSLSQKNVRERIAEALLFLKATYGFADDGQTLNITLSREEIADYVGTSTETAIRLLSEFNQDKLIELSGRKIKILNLDKLIKTAKLDY